MISTFKKSKWTSTLLAIILIISVGLIGLTGCKPLTNKDSSNNTTALSNAPVDTENKGTPAPTKETKEVFYG